MTGLYKHSLALLTDLYQLTMAYGYWKLGRQDEEASFHLSFRQNPFTGGYTVACGLQYAIDFVENLRFDESDLQYLGTLTGYDERPLFDRGFLNYLREFRITVDLDSVPEGTVVFPHEPVLRVNGSLLQGQLLETPLLNLFNFQTLVATKAARICQMARGEPVLEFGLRRAQGIDGGVAASRAAYVGGCAATSNLLAGQLFNIPVKGTHAHSWVMSFDDELEALQAYAKVMPNNVVLLVDTYDTLQGVRKAAIVGQQLKETGHQLLGIRLDSGDLAYLSIEARKILDAAGLQKTAILATNDLDEHIIASLKTQDASISIWGVGTKLATAFDQPALGGIYKLSAIRRAPGPWKYKIKLSEQSAKISIPGILQARRYSVRSECIGDAIYDELMGLETPATIVDPNDITRRKTLPANATTEDLLQPIFRAGQRVYEVPDIQSSRDRTASQLRQFHPGIKRLVNPHLYPVGLAKNLSQLRTDLILKLREQNGLQPDGSAS